MRKHLFANKEYYHIFNRGVEKRKVFLDDIDYYRFLDSIRLMNDERDGLMIMWRDCKRNNPNLSIDDFLRSNLRMEELKPLVEFICYSLLPNHFHFLMKQIKDRGIERFMQRLGTGYTMYFNKKYERSGVLFQGKFKSTHIQSNELLLYLSAYVNCNSEVHNIAKAEKYRWCSFRSYIAGTKNPIINKRIIESQFGKRSSEYLEFAKSNIAEIKEKRKSEESFLE